MSTACVSTMMTSAVGKGFLASGVMDARFLRPVYCDDELRTCGEVQGFSADGDAVRVHVSVTAHNQHGEQTLAATSSALCG